MTNKDYTALVFLVDRSGSMNPIARDMEGGISALIAEQRKLPGKLTVDITQFDNVVEDIYTFADPADVKFRLNPRGGTALYDALGQKINSFGEALRTMPEVERPAHVLFAVVTDGFENASREFRGVDVQRMVKHQTQTYDWNFTYLGANQDAVFVAKGLGIAAGSALTYNTANVHQMTRTFGEYTTSLRSGLVASYSDADRVKNA